MAYSEEFQASLPRSDTPDMDGSNLTIEGVEGESVRIGDGERSALYLQSRGEPLDLTAIRIVPSYVEAGWFVEANCVKLTDGKREAVFVPVGKP